MALTIGTKVVTKYAVTLGNVGTIVRYDSKGRAWVLWPSEKEPIPYQTKNLRAA